MKAEELRQLAGGEMDAKEKEMREQLFRLRFKLAGGQGESVKRIRELRKDIARLQTIRGEQERKNG